MALFRAVETAQPPSRRLFEDPYATDFLTGPLRMVAQLAPLPLFGRAVTWVLDVGWPRTRSSAVVRTRFIDDLVRGGLRDGAAQLVLLGAGFDSRAYRLEEARRVAVFEVDHPATQAAKRARLAARCRGAEAQAHFVAVDFERDDLETALRSAGFATDRISVVVWEGVVSYLSSAAVDQNFALLRRLTPRGSRLIFTYVDQGAIDGSVTFDEARRWSQWVRSSGEPFIFGFAPPALGPYLERHGFTLTSDASTAQIARQYRESSGRNEPGSDLYRVALAERQ